MKKLFNTICLLAFLQITVVYSQEFYDINKINEIDIVFDVDNWDAILDQLYSEGNEERFIGTLFVNGVQYDSVGVRYKGNSTYTADQIKNPLNIKVDYVIGDQTVNGYGTLKLSNAFKDPSFIRETLSYEIARKYLPSSKANYAKVTINGTYLGLYTNVQSVDKDFVKESFGSKNNAFFKGEISHTEPGSGPVIAWGYLGDDSTKYNNYYELKSDEGWNDLINFLNILNTNHENLDTVLNVDRHLWMLAFDILMVNLDAPINFAHNYYLYKDDTGRFNPVIWDLNENFGGFNSLFTSNKPLGLRDMQTLDPFVNSTAESYPIIKNVLAIPKYRKIYIAHLKTMINEIFLNNWYYTRALEIQGIIDTEVQADLNKFYTYSDFKNNLDFTVGSDMFRMIGIKELMSERISYILSLPEFQKTQPTITDVEHNISDLNVTFSAKVLDCNNVFLKYRQNPFGKFYVVEMFDDGKNNDGAANDGVYGTNITVEQAELQYYIYAENTEAVAFLPEQTENNPFTINLKAETSDLVINEILASNDNTIADNNGEYDDCIELFNNSDEDINLLGFYLTDEYGDLTKWAFPDTTILANSYLIVWADKDEEQSGLHANFKLSGSGEEVYLSDTEGKIIDNVVFGEQTADISIGRYPNGVGEFELMQPSIGFANEQILDVQSNSLSQPKNFSLSQNYPNPFNPSTTISFAIPKQSDVKLVVYNAIGEIVAELLNKNISAGYHQVNFDASNLSSGLYFYRISAGNFVDVKKMILLK